MEPTLSRASGLPWGLPRSNLFAGHPALESAVVRGRAGAGARGLPLWGGWELLIWAELGLAELG